MRKRVLVITYNMIPYAGTWGGCQRMFYLTEKLWRDGFEIFLVTCKKQNMGDFGKKIHCNFLALDVKNKLAQKYLYRKKNLFKEKIASKQLDFFSKFRNFIKNNSFLIKLLRIYDNLRYNEPDVISGFISSCWCKENRNTIIDIIDQKRIDCIIVSAPPFGMFSLIPFIRNMRPDVKIIADYRDPWNLWKKGNYFIQKREKEILEKSDIITCTNKNAQNALCDEFHINPSKVRVVRNGYAEKDWIDSDWFHSAQNEQFTIIYTGAISFQKNEYRDVNFFLDALCRLKREGRKIKIIFVGINPSQTDLDNAYIKELGSSLETVKPMPNCDAIKYVNNADVALLVHTAKDNSGKYIVSGKMYDYMRCKIPIFSIGRKDGAHSQMIHELNLGINVENNIDDIYCALVKLYTYWEKRELEKKFNYEYIDDISLYSRDKQNEIFESIILNDYK